MNISQKKLDRLIKTATKLSEKCEGRCNHVTLLIRGSKIVSHGINLSKTDTFAYKIYKYPYVHSELNAIKSCPRNIDITKCWILNVRLSKNRSKLMMSRPCRSCTKLIDAFGIRDVYFTNASGEMEKL